jgi:aminoglycoside 3-N-acetyltransferase
MERVGLLELRRGIRELGLAGRPVCVHSSLRSFGHVEGEADAVVEAFLVEGCTLVVPAFSWAFFVAPPSGIGPLRNAFDYDCLSETRGDSRIYASSTSEIDRSTGAVARAVVERPGRSRGAHPLSSFAAVGPDAESLVGVQAPRSMSTRP